MELKDLREKRIEMLNANKEFLATKADNNGILSDEDAKIYENMEKDIIKISDSIQRMEKLEETERRLNMPVNQPVHVNPSNNVTDSDVVVNVRDTKEYMNDFIASARKSFRMPTNYLNEGADASGGYLVPTEMDKDLVVGLEDENVMRKVAKVVKTSTNIDIPFVAQKPVATFVAEGASLTFGDEQFGNKVLKAYKLHAGVKVTNELLNDSAFDLKSHLVELFAQAIGGAEEDAMLNGDGNGKPTGIFDETNGGTFAVTTQANKIGLDDLFDLVYKLPRVYRKNACFIMNDDTVCQLRKLKDLQGAYIWQPSNIVGEPDTLMGYKVYVSPYAPVIEAGKPAVAFGDFSYYRIGDRGTRSMAELKELFIGNDQTGFLMKERVDGILTLKEAVNILTIKA